MIKTDSPHPSRQLNPFAFPSETDTRFTLFIIAVLLVAYSSGFIAIFAINPNLSDPFEGIAPPEIQLGDVNFFEEYGAYDLRLFKAASTALILPVGLAVAIFILATILYRLHPTRLRRQKHLEIIREESDPLLYREIQSLVRAVGMTSSPTVMIGKKTFSQSAQAFGFPGQYVLRLENGLRLLVRKSPGAFRAIVLHELAHIFNRDIGRTYFAQSLWRAALLLTILPTASILVLVSLHANFTRLVNGEFSLYRLLAINIPTVMVYLLKLGAVVFIAAAVRAALLRVREKYADARAAIWGGRDSLRALLERTYAHEKPVKGLHWWRLHPTLQERLTILNNPAHIFGLSSDLPFTVGLLTTVGLAPTFILAIYISLEIMASGGYLEAMFGDIAFTNLPSVIRMLSVGLAWLIFTGKNILMGIFVALVLFGIAYLISNTVGLEVQRETVADITINRTGPIGYLRLALPAILMAFGLEVGFLIDPSTFLGLGAIFALDPPSFFSARGLIPTLLTLPEFVIAAGLFWLWLVYARFFGQRLLGSHTGVTSPKWKLRGMALVLSMIWWVLFLPVALVHVIIIAIGMRAMPVSQLDGFAPVFLLALAACLLIGSLFTYGIFFGASWILFKIGRLILPPHCPSCSRIIRHEVVIGKMCDHCGKDLAPWLFVDLQQVSMIDEASRSQIDIHARVM